MRKKWITWPSLWIDERKAFFWWFYERRIHNIKKRYRGSWGLCDISWSLHYFAYSFLCSILHSWSSSRWWLLQRWFHSPLFYGVVRAFFGCFYGNVNLKHLTDLAEKNFLKPTKQFWCSFIERNKQLLWLWNSTIYQNGFLGLKKFWPMARSLWKFICCHYRPTMHRSSDMFCTNSFHDTLWKNDPWLKVKIRSKKEKWGGGLYWIIS